MTFTRRTSRQASFACSIPPKARSAAWCACSRGHAVGDVSRDAAVDMVADFFVELLLDARAAENQSQLKLQGGQQAPAAASLQLLQLDDARDRSREPFPVGRFPIEGAPASARERVELGAAAGVGDLPRGSEPALVLELVERR